MEEFHREAQEFYTQCSAEFKGIAVKLFKCMDTDGDSSIDVAEMASFLTETGNLSRMMTAEQLVFIIDRNGNGKLDFNEFITFFYVLFGGAVCDGCGAKFMGQRRLTCITCFTKDDSCNICSSCFSSKTFVHVHRVKDGSFVDLAALVLRTDSNNNQVEAGIESSKKQSLSSRLTSPEGLKKLERVHKVTKVSLEVVQLMTSAGCNIM